MTELNSTASVKHVAWPLSREVRKAGRAGGAKVLAPTLGRSDLGCRCKYGLRISALQAGEMEDLLYQEPPSPSPASFP
jgi:hypothetical protein